MDESNDGWSALGGIFVLVIVFGLSLFIAKDAAKNRVSFIAKDYQPTDQTIWFFVCLLVCGLGFLYYLYRRSVVLQIKDSHGVTLDPVVPIAQEVKSGQPGTLESQLETLVRLKDKGLITEDELRQKRRQLLGL